MDRELQWVPIQKKIPLEVDKKGQEQTRRRSLNLRGYPSIEPE